VRPRIRTIKPEFWDDLAVCALSRDARLTAIALISAADDRGRLELNPSEIRTYAFKRDKVTDRRVTTWIQEVIRAAIAAAYEVGDWAYLWLPNFWRHQVINKPTESQLPPHPEDPYGHLSISEGLAQFRDASRSDSGSTPVALRPSCGGAGGRAAARSSLPFPSSSSSSTENDKSSGDSARKAAKVDQDLPADRLPLLADLLGILHRIWEQRGGTIEPQPRGVGLGMLRNLAADHLGVARSLEHWLTSGKGQRASTADIAKRFGDWCADAPAGSPARVGSGSHSPAPSALDRKRLGALNNLTANGGTT
jgi:hypothetical protein